MKVELMKEAYGMLYEIENLLRVEINTIMVSNYGIGWMIKAPVLHKYKPFTKRCLQEFYLYEIISLASSYECIKIPLAATLKNLRQVPPIRNKIAHSKLIEQKEFDLLQEVYNKLNVIFSQKQLIV